ncbi:hypothetical protein D9619_010027 [Psilocybe cf. subviscida]|uniref:F-box domain-containing protein n=1 Tax=Psilocybe cf. subviscida TaxID=2480587 RepID=A0A8H5F6F5_9AGAR|nr:hypothetical protein D9619_010027 [Psilocybe cf. subviscida]
MATYNSFYEAQLMIDEEIADLTARMQESIRLLKARRNELAPVTKLPDEILFQIFVIFQDSIDLQHRQWQQIAHVCRYWRHVAVGSPSLWTRLHNPPHALTQLMLERSKNAPLDVALTGMWLKKTILTGTLAIILQAIERIRTIKFEVMPFSVLDTVHDIFAGLDRDWEASSLETLIIGAEVQQGPPPASVRVVTNVFRSTSLLRRLSVKYGYYNWGMLPLPSLTHLDLRGMSLGNVSGAHLIETLRQMPNLKTLKINWKNMNIHQFPPTPHPQPIHLPCLQTLKIFDSHQAHLELFLSLIVLPKLHQLVADPDPVNDVVTFTNMILSLIRKANFGPLEFFSIKRQDVMISTSPGANIYNDDETSSFINIYIVPDDEDALDDDCTRFEFVADILSCITLLDCPDKIPLRYISLDCLDAPVGQFTHLFSRLPHLETIEVRQHLGLVLFEALDVTSYISSGATPSAPIPFPKLSSITWNGKAHQYSSSIPMLSLAVFNNLYNSLLSRYDISVPSITLKLVDCGHLDDAQVHQFQEIGVKIVVS